MRQGPGLLSFACLEKNVSTCIYFSFFLIVIYTVITTISREYICSGDYHADSTWDTLIKNSILLTFSITLCVLKHALRVKNSILRNL